MDMIILVSLGLLWQINKLIDKSFSYQRPRIFSLVSVHKVSRTR